MLAELGPYVYLIVSFAGALIITNAFNYQVKIPRLFFIALLFVTGIRYLLWRFQVSIMAISPTTFEGFWVWLCFFVEIGILFELFMIFMTFLKFKDRSKEADTYEKLLRTMDPSKLPTIDVFIPTYSESLEILERSIHGCLYLDWPTEKINVWILDDGKRDWLHQYCDERGVGYISRGRNDHAKAGNINYALSQTKGKFIVVFDADFIPFRQFLWRTIGFFQDPTVGILQTPQKYLNQDYIQSNLHLHDVCPDEQNTFYASLMPARDGWNSAFWCGTSAVLRREALEKIGGVPTHSLTEDISTTMKILRHGYRTIFLNEILSHGLSPESMESLFSQRKRWCRGTIQLFHSKDGPLGPGLTFIQRLMYIPYHWLFTPVARIFTLLVPIIYLWFGVPSIIIENYMEVIDFQLPFVALNTLAFLWFTNRNYLPFVPIAGATLSAFYILPTQIHAHFRRQNGGKFFVTPKSETHRQLTIHYQALSITLIFFFLTIVGLFLNMESFLHHDLRDPFFLVASFWAIKNLIMLLIMILLCVEHPRPRRHERFKVNQFYHILVDEKPYRAYIKDLALEGINLMVSPLLNLKRGETCQLMLPDIGIVTAKVVKEDPHGLTLTFIHLPQKERENLLKFLYTGRFQNITGAVNYKGFFKKLFRRLFGHHKSLYYHKDS
jgi:cellulose synthase (UDP-forming)